MNNKFFSFAGFNFKFIFEVKDQPGITNILKGQIFEICSLFETKKTSKKIDFTIRFKETTNFHILTKRYSDNYFLKFYETKINKEIIVFNHLSIIQVLYIIRNALIKILSSHQGFFLHGSAVLNHKNKALIFLGDQGAGKSTIVSLLKNKFTPLVDDVLIIRKIDEKYFLFQTPLIEKNQYLKGKNPFLIDKIFVLKKSLYNKILPIDNQAIISLLLLQLLTEKKILSHNTKQIFDFIKEFNNNFFQLFFNLDKNKVQDQLTIT